MKDYLARLYHDGRLTDAGLDNAVARGWITAQDAADIRDGYGAPEPEPVEEPVA